jgi:DNA ligase-1
MSTPIKVIKYHLIDRDYFNNTILKTPSRIEYIIQPKLDGMRASIQCGKVLSSTLKPIPNKNIQNLFKSWEGLDGEFIHPEGLAKTISIVMSQDAAIDGLKFVVFDVISPLTKTYAERFRDLYIVDKAKLWGLPIDVIPFRTLDKEKDTYESLAVKTLNTDGHMIKSASSFYVKGRAPKFTGGKIKAYDEHEYQILGFDYLKHNHNEQFISELGLSKRSSHQENKVADKTLLGSFYCKIVINGVEKYFSVGSGLTAEERRTYVTMIDNLMNNYLVKVKHLGFTKDGFPREPIFTGIRPKIDVTNW